MHAIIRAGAAIRTCRDHALDDRTVMDPLFLIHAAATWAMVGVIWVVQVVVYPAFGDVPATAFADYERNHQRRMIRVLAVFAPLELVTALLVFVVPGSVPRWLPLVAGMILAGLWISTGVFYAPLHGRLSEGYDDGRIRLLIRSNWLRTAGWTARGALAAVMLALAV